jgi:serine/threonine-protein kinase
MAAGATTPTVLPFTGLTDPYGPCGVAVDAAGNVYVAGSGIVVGTGRVEKLAPGASTPTVLPFTGLSDPYGVAVDTAGNVYVADRGSNRIVKLPAR